MSPEADEPAQERYLHPAKHGQLDELEAFDAYQSWQHDQGVPILHGSSVDNIEALEVGPWPRLSAQGALLNLHGSGGLIDAHVLELAPGGHAAPERHLYEEISFVLSGRGTTSVWYEGRSKQTFEWSAGSLFAIPLNAWYQHFNGAGTQASRLFSVTNRPGMLNTFRNREFVFNNEFVFSDRFDGSEGYFSREGKLWHRGLNHVWETNLVPDVRTQTLHPNGEPGVGTLDEELALAQNNMGAYIAEIIAGTYQKARRLSTPEHLLVLSGEGFTLSWRDGDDHAWRQDWQAGALMMQREGWYSQHFNMGRQRARYLTIRFRGVQFQHLTEHVHHDDGHEHEHEHEHDFDHIRLRDHDDDHDHGHDHDHAHDEHDHDHDHVHVHDHDEHAHAAHDHDDDDIAVTGDTFIEYEDEDPAIRALFESELAKRRIPSEMDRLLERWRQYQAAAEARAKE